jgi:hypothetical protein
VERHHDGQMLHVQAEWGVCGLFSSSLQCGFHYLECFFFFFFFLLFLGFPWLCLDVLLICITAGGFLAGQGVLRCGK